MARQDGRIHCTFESYMTFIIIVLLLFCLNLVSCLLSPSDKPLSKSVWILKYAHSNLYQPELTLEKKIHSSSEAPAFCHSSFTKLRSIIWTLEQMCLFLFHVKAKLRNLLICKEKIILLNVHLISNCDNSEVDNSENSVLHILTTKHFNF
jgi:hypothetical protein